MNRNIGFSVILFFVFGTMLSCKKHAQESAQIITGEKVFYYTGNKDKNYLYELKGSYAIQLDTTMAYEKILEKLKNTSGIYYITTFTSYDRNIEIVSAPNLSANEIRKVSGVMNVMNRYTSNPDSFYTVITMDGIITCKLKPNISMSDVLKVINNRAKIINGEASMLEVMDWDKLFEYNNKLYESGLVEYCEPNFSGGFRLFK